MLWCIAPILTGFSGAIFLKKRLLLKQFLAGCKPFMIELAPFAFAGFGVTGWGRISSRGKGACLEPTLALRRLLVPCAPMCPRLPLPPVGVSSRVRPPLACSASSRLSFICCGSRTWTCSSRSTGAQLFVLVYALALGKGPSVLLTIIAALGLPMVRSRPLASYEMPVCSLFGVALISRPQFLFDGLPGLLDFVTPQQRMIPVVSAGDVTVPLSDISSHLSSQRSPGGRRRGERYT